MKDASEDLLTAQVLHEHRYAKDTSTLRFNRRSGKYLPRTAAEDEELVDMAGKTPIDLEDLGYLREVLEQQKIPIKWTPHPVTKGTRKVITS